MIILKSIIKTNNDLFRYGGATTYTTPSSYGMPSSSYSTTAQTPANAPAQAAPSQPTSWDSSINTAALSAAVSSIAQASQSTVSGITV